MIRPLPRMDRSDRSARCASGASPGQARCGYGDPRRQRSRRAPARSPRARNQTSTCPKASCCHLIGSPLLQADRRGPVRRSHERARTRESPRPRGPPGGRGVGGRVPRLAPRPLRHRRHDPRRRRPPPGPPLSGFRRRRFVPRHPPRRAATSCPVRHRERPDLPGAAGPGLEMSGAAWHPGKRQGSDDTVFLDGKDPGCCIERGM